MLGVLKSSITTSTTTITIVKDNFIAMVAAAPSSSSSSVRKSTNLYENKSFVVVTTALITWIVASFYFSLRFDHGSGARSPVAKRTTGSSVSMARIASRHDHSPRFKSTKKLAIESTLKKDTVTVTTGGTKDHDTKSGNYNYNNNNNKENNNKKKPHKSYINMTNYDGPSTVWKSYPYDFPCVPGETTHMLITPAHEGILFQRPVKTGSTTLTSIILRLVERYKHSGMSKQQRCKYRAMHATSRDLEYAKRDKSKSYLLSVVRDPTHKAISRFFHFDVSVGRNEPTDEYFTQIMGRVYNQNSLTQDLTTKPIPQIIPPTANATRIVQDILADYDFIAVTERMDESLVVWKMLFHLDFYDILYTKARSSGTFSNGHPKRPCIYLVPSFLSHGMEAFFESEQWKQSNAVDILLYQAIYQSLDNTIDALGRDRFHAELKLFHQAQEYANDFCKGKVVNFCSSGGAFVPEEKRTCVIWGEGCDFECLKAFRTMNGLKELLLNP